MRSARKVLVVDDSDDQRRFLVEIVGRTLPGWRVIPAIDLPQALSLIGQNPDLDIAVVDLFLSQSPTLREGLDVLAELERAAPRCFRILVSRFARKWPKTDGTAPSWHGFVSLQYDDTSPAAALGAALVDAKAQCESRAQSCSSPS